MKTFSEFLLEATKVVISKLGEDGIQIYDKTVDESVQLYCHNYLKDISKGKFSKVGIYISTSGEKEKFLAKNLSKEKLYLDITKEIKALFFENKALFEKYKIVLKSDNDPISLYIFGNTTILEYDVKKFENIFKDFYKNIEEIFSKAITK